MRGREREKRKIERGGERDGKTEGGENSTQTISACQRGRSRRKEKLAGQQ